MKLNEWFSESKENKQAIYYARNGRTYIYRNGQRLSNFAKKLEIEQVVKLNGESGFGAWLY